MNEVEHLSSKVKYHDGKRFIKKYLDDGTPVWKLDTKFVEVN
ncbi:MAG: hypothetical protein WC307_06090 [Candidatus Nanoarchaeia archaeon]|jgi:hypothetical protein